MITPEHLNIIVKEVPKEATSLIHGVTPDDSSSVLVDIVALPRVPDENFFGGLAVGNRLLVESHGIHRYQVGGDEIMMVAWAFVLCSIR